MKLLTKHTSSYRLTIASTSSMSSNLRHCSNESLICYRPIEDRGGLWMAEMWLKYSSEHGWSVGPSEHKLHLGLFQRETMASGGIWGLGICGRGSTATPAIAAGRGRKGGGRRWSLRRLFYTNPLLSPPFSRWFINVHRFILFRRKMGHIWKTFHIKRIIENP